MHASMCVKGDLVVDDDDDDDVATDGLLCKQCQIDFPSEPISHHRNGIIYI
jgi:hypothetical protein